MLDAIPIGDAALNMLTDLVNQDTAVRGYLLTGDDSYLAPYRLGKEQLDKNLAMIRELEAGHPIMKDLVENQANPEIVKLRDYFESQIKLVQAGKIAEARLNVGKGKEAMDAFRAVNVKIQADVDKLTNDAWQAAKKEEDNAKLAIIGFGTVSLLVAVFSAVYLARTIVRPIRQINLQMREIAEGEGDLTQELKIKSKDEIGDLSKTFNAMLHNLRSMIQQVGLSADQVAASSEQLTASAQQAGSGTDQIAATMQEVAIGSERQMQSVVEVVQASNDMSQGVATIAASARQVSGTAGLASEAASQGAGAIQTAVEQMQSIHQTVQDLQNSVHILSDRSVDIGQIVEVITGISAQTNLLALNAAIEAARAGEQGKGFAVVADEVRKLAEQSAVSAQQITELIANIQAETRRTAKSTEVAAQEVVTGIENVTVAGNAFAGIRNSVQDMSVQIEAVSQTAQQIAVRTENVVEMVENIAAVTEETASGTQNVSASVEEQVASMEEISQSATSLTEMAAELQALVGKFKV
ncbi:methyl-accepting chemotaxis protein [Tumebacillus sp. BK434]|uniref:methyl-accepting chemotaxis protein n=1 Tax=Tumebacillus sp. BK434 TaxID=2512169 RepID=UPI003260986E